MSRAKKVKASKADLSKVAKSPEKNHIVNSSKTSPKRNSKRKAVDEVKENEKEKVDIAARTKTVEADNPPSKKSKKSSAEPKEEEDEKISEAKPKAAPKAKKAPVAKTKKEDKTKPVISPVGVSDQKENTITNESPKKEIPLEVNQANNTESMTCVGITGTTATKHTKVPV
jgi:hypothetical protein